MRAALVDREGRIHGRVKAPTPAGDVMAALKGAIEGLAKDDVINDVIGVGIGVAGLVDRRAKRVLISPNIRSLDGQGFEGLYPGRTLALENDANAAAMGELWLGAGKRFPSFVLLTLGTGIGGGFIHNGRLLDVAAEAGHMSIDKEGPKCVCGNYGCLELFASARAITGAVVKALEGGVESALRGLYEGNVYKLTAEDIFKAASDGDGLSREALKEAGRYLGVGIANLINLLSPDAVLLAGGLTGAWDIYVAEAVKEAQKRALKSLFESVGILPASLGDDAGVLGAARLVLEPDSA